MHLKSRAIYFLVIKPLSLLPLNVLHQLSNFLYYPLYYIIGFRKKVVFQNLARSFPEKTAAELKDISRKFYRHFCDLIVESVKLFSISKEELLERSKVINPELLEAYYEQNKSVIIVAGHYNNWEIFAQSCNLLMKHQAVGIYTPLTDAYFEKKFARSRGKYDVVLLPKREVKEYFAANTSVVKAIIFGIDQSPSSRTKKVYWTKFLNQDTAVLFGSEKYATEYNYPILFADMTKVKRGYYEIEYEILEEEPRFAKYGSITEKHTRLLEKQILQQPEHWLWSHKRWKRKKSDFAEKSHS